MVHNLDEELQDKIICERLQTTVIPPIFMVRLLKIIDILQDNFLYIVLYVVQNNRLFGITFSAV